MINRTSNPNTMRSQTASAASIQSVGQSVTSKSYALMERPVPTKIPKRRALPDNFLLKRLDVLYWKRLLRYFYIRFLRMQGSPEAIARGMAVGVFAGSFPLLGLQTVVGIALAALFRGNKVMAAVSTWISNPLTYVPMMALNFHIGRSLLRLPASDLPLSAAGLDQWMDLGLSVTGSLMLGSLVTGLVLSIVAYYFGLKVAQQVRSRRQAKKK